MALVDGDHRARRQAFGPRQVLPQEFEKPGDGCRGGEGELGLRQPQQVGVGGEEEDSDCHGSEDKGPGGKQ